MRAGAGSARFFLDTTEMFDPKANTWRLLDARLPVARTSLSGEKANGDQILAVGGFEPRNPPFVASARVDSFHIGPL